MLDKPWYWSHTVGGVGIIVVDPVDEFLERLSVRYLDTARDAGAATIESFVGHPVELSLAFFHPYHGNWFPDLDPAIGSLIPGFDRSAPLAGVGWIVRGVEESGLLHDEEGRTELPKRGRELCRRLLDGKPLLCLCGGGRWARAAVGSTEPGHDLAAVLAYNEDDWLDWIPGTAATGSPTSLWDRARHAADRANAIEVRSALAEGRRRYSPAGRRLFELGILNLLALRVADRQGEQPEHPRRGN